MSPRGRPRGQGRPRGLHLCYLSDSNYFLLPFISVSNATRNLTP